ncbi:hypothetical protein MGN70_001580 [Eutypa lata]|uniref:Uncharacterized protein n=1 Tax=Eutypa lata (strain UCR-EL1) TaxID=1287681 RepID=M7SF71_EUTLA|nr:hypothetical protein UCREL1_8130 [Eutypa lata UCREL1]KAI1256456.1 hypothetical protein MGN70_001580 [Eutypa lata]
MPATTHSTADDMIGKRSDSDVIIGTPQDVLKFLNELVFFIVVAMAGVWALMAAFFIFHFRRPRRSASIDDAIEMYQIRRPRQRAEPELLIFGAPEDRLWLQQQQLQRQRPTTVSVPAANTAAASYFQPPVPVPVVVVGEYVRGDENESLTVVDDSNITTTKV